MDITPKTHLLKSLRGERVNYRLLIGEAIDNALDAEAASVHVILDGDAVSFKDDGVGITRDRFPALFGLGDHAEMASTQLGRFGVGITAQAINAGDVLTVDTTSSDGRLTGSANWANVMRDGEWKLPDPRWKPFVVGQTGTTITIEKLRKPPKGTLDRITAEIAQIFHPAVLDGKRISYNGNQVECLREPEMTDIVERQFALSGGRSAHLRAGILTGQSKLCRVHVAYKHRVIMPGSSFGCGEYGGIAKMFARLQLAGPWELAKFKDELTDESEREELEDAVSATLEPILEKCNAASIDARLAEIALKLNEKLVVAGLARPRKKKPPRDVIVDPPEKRKRKPGHVDPDKSDPASGPAKTGKRPPQQDLKIDFEDIAEEHGIGMFQASKGRGPHRVILSKDHPTIQKLLEHRDDTLLLDQIYLIAIMLFERERKQDDLFIPFGKRVAETLALQSEDGTSRAAS